MFVYMMVTKDKYELPLAVVDSAEELSKISGKSVNTIRSSACHVKTGKLKHSAFHRIEIKEGSDD